MEQGYKFYRIVVLEIYVKHYYLKKPILAKIIAINVKPANQVIIMLRMTVIITPPLVNMDNNVII